MKPLSVGVIGCGHIAPAHLRAWRKVTGFKVTGVYDVNKDLAVARATEFHIDHVADSLERLIASCDVIDVCTPPHTHAAIAKEVLQCAKHLIIEKPMVTDVADWTSIRALAQESGAKIAVLHNLKFSPAVMLAQKWVAEGRIGPLIGLTREFLTSPQTDRMLVGNTHWSHSLPGGRWFETLPHELYLTHMFLGALPLDSVTAVSTTAAPPGARADEVLVALKGERSIASIRFSANARINKRMLTLHGTHGEIIVDVLSHAVMRHSILDRGVNRAIGIQFLRAGQSLVHMLGDRTKYLVHRARRETPHAAIIKAFGASILTGAAEPTPLDEVDYVVRNCEAIGVEIDRQLLKSTSLQFPPL